MNNIMELSTFSDWFGILGGIALVAVWIRKLHKWLRSKSAEISKAIEDGELLVSELLNRATSPTRRADIYAYIHFLNVEMESSRTRRLVQIMGVFCVICVLGLLYSTINIELAIDSISWLWWLFNVTLLAAIISLLLMLITSWQVWKMQSSWQSKASNILRERALSYITET